MPAMFAALLGPIAAVNSGRLRSGLTTEWELEIIEDLGDAARLTAALARADAVVAQRYLASFPPAPGLRLVQVHGAGYDLVDMAAVPDAATVCNAYGHDIGIAEFCLLGMLQWCHRLVEMHQEFRDRGSWAPGAPASGPLHDEVYGKTVGIVGLGRIGRQLATRCKAMGMRVLAVNRSVGPVPQGVDRLEGLDRLEALAAESDFVVVTCALTEETRGLVGPAALAAMKPTGVIMNIARGPVIDEDALYEALAEKRIGGGVLDTWYVYPTQGDPNPRPSRHPFHTLDNVYMTPHASGWTEGQATRRWAQISGNLNALARGEPLDNVVRPALR